MNKNKEGSVQWRTTGFEPLGIGDELVGSRFLNFPQKFRSMKAYGKRRQDEMCCPGHSKFPADKYNTRASLKAHTRDTRYAHKRARAENRQEVFRLQQKINDVN